jgi:site-specific DNA recombinase
MLPPLHKVDAIYARYSSPKQNDGTSIQVQLDHAHRDADADAIEYVDRARTGRALGKRIEFKGLRADIEAGKIKRLFVYMYNRLGRSSKLHSIVEEFEKQGCEVISCTEGRDAVVRGIQLVLGKDYSDRLARTTRDGLMQRFRQGTHTGGEVRYGYQTVTGEDGRSRYSVHPQEIEVVRQVFKMYQSEQVGYKAIARRLDEMGIPTRTGVSWTHTTIRSILTNTCVIGQIKYHQRQFMLDDESGN